MTWNNSSEYPMGSSTKPWNIWDDVLCVGGFCIPMEAMPSDICQSVSWGIFKKYMNGNLYY